MRPGALAALGRPLTFHPSRPTIARPAPFRSLPRRSHEAAVFDALGDWLDAQPPNRRRLSAALLGIILLTLPCYGVGGAVYLMSAPPAPGGPAADGATPTTAATAADSIPAATEAPPPTEADDDSTAVPTIVRRATITSGPVLPPAAPTDTPVATPFAPSATPPPTDAPTLAPTIPVADTATSPPPTDAPTIAAPTDAPTAAPTSPPDPTSAPPADPTAEPTSGAPARLDRGPAKPA